MRLETRPLDPAGDDPLEPLLGARVFASPRFARLWRARGGTAVAWILEDAGAVAAALPGVEFGRGPFTRFYSMPDGGYGGIFVSPGRREERDRFVRMLLDAVAARRYARAWIFDYHRTLDGAARWPVVEQRTTLVDISRPGWAPPDAKLLAQIRKAEREGIRVEPFDWDRHHAAFLDLVRGTERRHGRRTPWYSADFYSGLSRLVETDVRFRWYWCEHEGTGACSHIYLLENGVLQGWQIYFDKMFSWLKPNQYIRFTVCHEMAERGITRLNLGGTPENAPGLGYYKARWGGEAVRYPAYVLRSLLGRFG